MEIILFMLLLEIFGKIIQKAFYMPLLLFACIVLSLVFQLQNRKKSFYLPLILYSAFALILFSAGTFISFFETDASIRNRIQEFVNVSFASIELIIFGIYFHKIFSRRIASILILFSVCGFLIIIAQFYIAAFDNNSSVDRVITLADRSIAFELTILIIYCLSYYYVLLKDTSNKTLLQSPSFWIVTALLFYSIISAPFFTVGIQILKGSPQLYDALYGIHYLFASILFLSICKACLCRQPLVN